MFVSSSLFFYDNILGKSLRVGFLLQSFSKDFRAIPFAGSSLELKILVLSWKIKTATNTRIYTYFFVFIRTFVAKKLNYSTNSHLFLHGHSCLRGKKKTELIHKFTLISSCPFVPSWQKKNTPSFDTTIPFGKFLITSCAFSS